jgi:hypothetical protein
MWTTAHSQAVGGRAVAEATAVMAKKKPDEQKEVREDFIRIRMTSRFKAWLQRYADYRHLTVADTVMLSVIDDAKAKGFKEGPPKR